jgi:23S rRNA (pseudouridine1915-N3)-methyltransferase
MLIRILAVGTRMPDWVDVAVADYTARMPAEMRVEWREIKAEPRTGNGSAAAWMAREATRLRAAIPEGARCVALDERGSDLDTRGFAARLGAWRDEHRVVALLIGGPDGLDPALKRDCVERLRLSSLTLPHPLARIVLAEQIYRAWSVISGHPYHRD